jgi:hypothetical protein
MLKGDSYQPMRTTFYWIPVQMRKMQIKEAPRQAAAQLRALEKHIYFLACYASSV